MSKNIIFVRTVVNLPLPRAETKYVSPRHDHVVKPINNFAIVAAGAAK
jgi:hypothetical protein